MAVKGVFASDSGITAERKDDFASALVKTGATGSAPLFALTSGMKSRSIAAVIHTWFEENALTGRINVTNNAGTGTSFTVDDATQVVVGQIFLVEATGENVFVTAVAGTTVTVERAFASTTASAIDGSSTAVPIQLLSNAHEEGSAKPTSVANIGYPRFNYMQIFRNPWDLTRTASQVDYQTGDKTAKTRSDALHLHGRDIERALMFGRKSVGVKNGKPFRTMDGLFTQITTNVNAQGSDFGYTDMRDFLQSVFERNIMGAPNERIAFCGNSVLSVLDTIVNSGATNSQMNLETGQTDFGMEINKWRTPFGSITLMTHPMLVESPLWTKDLYVIHPAAVELLYLQHTKEDTYDKDGSRAGVDADFGVFTAEMTSAYKAELTGGIYTGIDTPRTSGL